MRGGFGNFDWGMFGGTGGENGNGAQNEKSPLKMTGAQKMFAVFLALIVVIIFAFEFGKEQAKKEQVSTDLYNESTVETAPETENNEGLIFQSGFTAIDMKVDSVFGNERRWLVNDYKQTFNTEEGKAAMLWKIEEYRAKEKKFRDSLKKMYLKKIEHVVDLKTRNYHKKILDSIQKDPANKMSKISKELLADDILEMRKIMINDSLARIYGTNHETDPQIVFNDNAQNDALKAPDGAHVKKEISFSEIVWLLLAVVGLVGVYSYFIRKKPFDMGGSYVSESIKLILIVILGSTLLYIFYPLIAAFGYNWLVWILISGVIVLLYRLFSEDIDILKSGKK